MSNYVKYFLPTETPQKPKLKYLIVGWISLSFIFCFLFGILGQWSDKHKEKTPTATTIYNLPKYQITAFHKQWNFCCCWYLKHCKNRKALPWEHLISCQCVKLLVLNYFTITTIRHSQFGFSYLKAVLMFYIKFHTYNRQSRAT